MAALDFPDSPLVGDLYGGPGVQWRWDGTRWASTGGTSGGIGALALSVPLTTSVGGIVNETDIGLSVSCDLADGRVYRVVGDLYVYSSVAGDGAVIKLTDGAGGQINSTQSMLGGAGVAQRMHVEHTFRSSVTMPYTFKLRLQRTIGTGTLTAYGASNFPGSLVVEDITYDAGSGAPSPTPTPWTAPALLNGWLTYAPAPAMYRRVGDIVSWRGYLTAPATINTLPFAQVPVGFRLGQGSAEFIASGFANGRVKCTLTTSTAGDCAVNDGMLAGGNVSLTQYSWSVTP